MTIQTKTQVKQNTLLLQVIEQLENKLFCDLVMDYNSYADDNGYERIYDNTDDEIDMLYNSASEALKAAYFGDYNHSHDYFVLNGYGNLASFDYHPIQDDNCPIDISELAQWIIDNDLYNDYGIEVITIDDMLASIEDNITDVEDMLYKLAHYLNVAMDNDSYEGNVYDVMNELENYTYEQLQYVITLLGIELY